jgi:hypothetical protein
VRWGFNCDRDAPASSLFVVGLWNLMPYDGRRGVRSAIGCSCVRPRSPAVIGRYVRSTPLTDNAMNRQPAADLSVAGRCRLGSTRAGFR